MHQKNMKDKVILIDMDGVQADWQGMFDKLISTYMPHVPLITDESLNQYYAQDLYPEEHQMEIRKLMMTPGFYRDLKPIEGSIETIKKLAEKYTVFFCTAPLDGHETCASEKIEWVREHYGDEFANCIVITRDKTIVRGDILIDDKPDITGFAVPEWKQIIFDAPYNKGMHPRIDFWSEAEEVIEQVLNEIDSMHDNSGTLIMKA